MKGRKKHRVLLHQHEVIINGIVKGYLLDISEGGVYVHTQADFIAGVSLDLAFGIDGRRIKVKGTVQHQQPGVGIGVKFLNLNVDDHVHIRKFLGTRHHVVSGQTDGRRVLLVDDNAQSRALYRNRLMGNGFHTVEAVNGAEAFRKLQESRFDLVVLEVWIEGLDGFKILQLMKINPLLKNIPVIVLSSRCTPVDQDKALALGAKEYLVKMVTSPAKLLDRIGKLVGTEAIIH